MDKRESKWDRFVAHLIMDYLSILIFVIGCVWFLTPAVFYMEWTKYVSMYCWIGATMDHIISTQRNSKGIKESWDLPTTMAHGIDRFLNGLLMIIFYHI